jgi:hypothetical protein
MRGLVVAVLALAACGTSSTARDGSVDGRDDGVVHLQFDSGVEAGQSDAGTDVLGQDDSGEQTDSNQGDSLAQSDVLPQTDVIQHDAYPYTPGECNPSADTCLGAPTYPCHSTGSGFACPCVPGANPNCRAGEFCCSTTSIALCYAYETAPCI